MYADQPEANWTPGRSNSKSKPRPFFRRFRRRGLLRRMFWLGLAVLGFYMVRSSFWTPSRARRGRRGPHGLPTKPQLGNATVDVTSSYLQMVFGGLAPAPEKDANMITAVPIVHSCVGSESSKDSLDDFRRWKPDGDWPFSGPKLRIAVFSGVYNHVIDGVALTCNRLVAYLISQGHEVIVFAPTSDEPRIKHAGKFHAVPSMSFPGRPEYRIALGLPATARDVLLEFKPNLVHIATPDVLGFQAQSWAHDTRVPVVCAYHTHFAQYLAYYHLGALEGTLWRIMHQFYQGCIHTYVPTASVAQELGAHEVVREGVRLWTRGVDTKLFNPAKRCPEWREALGINDDEPVVLLVCRLVWEKALDLYAEVVNYLQDRGVAHRSVVVGDGPAMAGLQTLIPEAIFLGSLSGNELARAYASSDVFLFPSHTETFGITTLEAMSSGLPVVVANKNESTIVHHEGNGLLADIGDAQAFARFTERLVVNKELREEYGRAGRQRAETEFQWGRSFTNLMGHYSEALANSPPGPYDVDA